ncbi:histidine kinase [uncultured Croceitalea sp.]|uniref:sensor histidine kinase n=1 Tax=uncultured Croceitalea sp. TaxID=1798908 RepID=UPI00330691EB
MILERYRTKIALYLIWIVAALFTSTQLYLKTLQGNGTDSWFKLFAIQFIVWSIWGLLSPLIFWLGKRFRIDRQTYYRGVFIHIVFAIGIVLLYLSLYSVIWSFLGIGKFSWAIFVSYFKIFFLNLFHWHFFIYMAIIGLVHAIAYQAALKRQQQEAIVMEKQLLISELNMLKAQLSPHFLFNTINNVVSAIEQGKNQVASGMLIRLGEFLRMCLEEPRHKMIPLRKELDFVKKYLEIEGFRNKELEVIFHIDDNSNDFSVPSFVLQPIVENAIKHGISKSEAAKRIEIGSKEFNGYMRLYVYNQGPRLGQSKNEPTGIGLQNTTARLKKLYGKEGVFNLISVNDGVMAEIQIPIHTV